MTNGIKIPISGDLSGLNQAMNEFQQKAKTVFKELNGTAQIDTSGASRGMQDLEKSIQKVHDALARTASSDMGGKAIDGLSAGFEAAVANAKALEQAVGGVGGKASSSFNKTVSETRKLIAELEKARRLQATLAKQGHTMSTAQAGELEKDFQFLRQNSKGATRKQFDRFGSMGSMASNWRDGASNEVTARRQYNDVLRQLGLNAPGGSVPGGAAGAGQQQRTFAQYIAQATTRAAKGVWGAATPHGGVGGAIAQGAVHEAASGGGLLSMGGMGRLAGGMGIGAVAYGVTKAISAVSAKVDSSESESIGYADLLRQLGDTSSGFADLREAVRSASKGLDMSFGDGSKLAQSYVKGAGIDGMSGDTLRSELKTGGGLGRTLGLTPDAGAGLFATLRHSKVSGGDSDNKRFALMIGEAVARAGVFTKADDVLAAVAGYTQQATRASLSPASTESYMGAMSNLMNLKQAGLDPSGIGSMLGTVDNSFRSGGGEAQRNFLLGTLQKNMPGMTAVDMGYMQDAGMFAKAKDVFKAGNPAFDSADDGTKARYKRLGAQGGDKTFFDMAMEPLSRMGSDEQRKNMMGLFNLNDSQAASLQTATKLNGGKLSNTFSMLQGKYGIDPSKMDSAGLRNAIDIEYGDPSKLKGKAAWLRTQNLSEGEKASLDRAEAAPGDGNSTLKEVLVKLSAGRNTELNEGDASRKNMTNLDNLASDMATKLIPMTNAIRESITWLATKAGYNDKYGKSEAALSTLNEGLSNGGSPELRRDYIGQTLAKVRANPDDYTREFKERVQTMYGESTAIAPVPVDNGGELPSGKVTASGKRIREVATLVNSPSARHDQLFKDAAKKHGVDWLDLKQIAAQESNLDAWATNRNTNGTVDQGLMQLNDRYNASRGLNAQSAMDPASNVDAGAAVWAQALKRSKGDVRGAFKNYNGAGPAAEKYADNAMAMRNAIRGGGARAAQAAAVPVPAPSAGPRMPAGDASSAVGELMTFGGRMMSSITGTPLPAGASTAQAPGRQTVDLSGNFTLSDAATGLGV
ncbi:transglycosylase SLT domain-containing protein [Massilia sp. P8910]|uniref:transglycosylase SLT domain-containing protein n=1 Tax=Massilia antarctica TaxID=2765360 RepID=UPI001E3E49D5|nr:transglycosylase SLT domain-containing protein [Massilia antarctica]MCE3605732.1 transglycosylase SLT domain-containing protein [Massilia antarctica]